MHVVVTGGSSGIGLAIAKIYAARGANVSLIARDPQRLETAQSELIRNGIPSNHIFIQSADVGDAAAMMEAGQACEAQFGPCDVLVASAGIVKPARFDALSGEDFASQMTTNVLGAANAVRAFYAGMARRGAGKIMLISSGAALIGLFGYTAYCASKSALAGFAEALGAEALLSGIHVGICFPPDTLTPQYLAEMPLRPPEAQLLMGTVKPWPVEKVAEKVVLGIDRNRTKIYFGFSIAALGILGPFIKPILNRWFAHKLQQARPPGR